MNDRINYADHMYRAMHRLIAGVLSEVAESGLPGDHHFYVTFDTRHPNTVVPSHLLDSHPEDMTIVLQNWFRDLNVDDSGFSVVLSFNDVLERIEIPFDAVTTFVDPAAEFGLSFEYVHTPKPDSEGATAAPMVEIETPAGDPSSNETGKVVSLDAFRKPSST